MGPRNNRTYGQTDATFRWYSVWGVHREHVSIKHGASGVKLYPGSANAHDRRNGVPGEGGGGLCGGGDGVGEGGSGPSGDEDDESSGGLAGGQLEARRLRGQRTARRARAHVRDC